MSGDLEVLVREQLVKALGAPDLRAVVALERTAAALERIGDLLHEIGLGAVVDAGPDAAPCLHPREERVDYSAMGRPRWRCKVCGHSVGLEGLEGLEGVKHGG